MASIAFDCNRLYLPTQRKLNAAWREMEDGEQVFPHWDVHRGN